MMLEMYISSLFSFLIFLLLLPLSSRKHFWRTRTSWSSNNPKTLIDIMSYNLLYWDVPKKICLWHSLEHPCSFQWLIANICGIEMVKRNEEDDQAFSKYTPITIFYVHLLFKQMKTGYATLKIDIFKNISTCFKWQKWNLNLFSRGEVWWSQGHMRKSWNKPE